MDGFRVLAVEISAARRIRVHASFGWWFSLAVYPGVGLPGRTAVPFLVFQGAAVVSSIMTAPVYDDFPCRGCTFSLTVQEGSLFSMPSPAFVVCRFFSDSHSDWCEVVPRCRFDFRFSDNL